MFIVSKTYLLLIVLRTLHEHLRHVYIVDGFGKHDLHLHRRQELHIPWAEKVCYKCYKK